MINNIEYIISPIEETTDAVVDILKNWVFVNEVNDIHIIEIESYLSDFLDEELKDDLYCLIEYPYVDKVYRDSYYSYFSSKHYSYKRDSIRISLFGSEINPELFFRSNSHFSLQSSYLGFFIIRPLRSSIFGRSHINPKAFKIKAELCSFNHNSMVLGAKLSCEGFPHSGQDSETISCAETTIWSLMEYFGTKYAEYQPTLPSKILSTLKSISFQRQLPSNGLTVNQISYALREFGFGTRIYSKETEGKEDFFKLINYYIESGIPIVIGLETDDLAHAVIAIGKEKKSFRVTDVSEEQKGLTKDGVSYIDYASNSSKIIIQDDNFSPYQAVNAKTIGEIYEDGSEEKNYKSKFLIVPLYPKIYLEATIAKEQILAFICEKPFAYSFKSDFILRMFLASSRSFKAHISVLKNMPDSMKFEIISAKMPKFIWCAEFYQEDIINNRSEASGLLLLDATEANQTNLDSLIFAGYPDKCIFLVENKFVALNQKFTGYQYFTNLTQF